MAGAFTHFIICDVAKRRRSVIGTELWKILNRHSEFLFLGAASPDLPYLSFKAGEVNWADVMHYESTSGIVASGYNELKGHWPSKTVADEIKLAWLLGYVSHLVADATIHPVVQAIVGLYEENKEEHRICEMTQDSLIFHMNKKTDIYYGEFSSILKFCKESPHFDDVMEFWKGQVLYNYADKGEEPHPTFWFTTYTKAIDAAEGGSDVVGLFRHLGIGTDYIYRPRDEIVRDYPEYFEKYFQKVELPDGNVGSFSSDGFEKAVINLLSAWNTLYSGLGKAAIVALSIIKNWNLDTGVNMDSPKKEVTYWA
jgi:hypothetical protein